MQNNPFRINTLRPEDPYCDREEECRTLVTHGVNGTGVTLFSPRRYGKTSLIRRVQQEIAARGGYVVYADFFRVMSVEDLAGRLARAVYEGLHRHASLLEKGKHVVLEFFKTYRPVLTPTPNGGLQIDVRPGAGLTGYELLDALLAEIGEFAAACGKPVHVAMDEFQDVTEIDKGKAEAMLRTHLQSHDAAYLFAGSRRSVLKAIFTDRDRPFYGSTILMELPPLPLNDLAAYIETQFKENGSSISRQSAEHICRRTQGYPYYAQFVSYILFNGPPEPDGEAVERAFDRMLDSERYAYQGVVDGLTAVQRGTLVGVAREPGALVTSRDFLAANRLTQGGVQKAVAHLEKQDHLVREGRGWHMVDPVFGEWLDRTF